MPHLVNSTCTKNCTGEKSPQTLVLNVAKQWVTSAPDGGNVTQCDRSFIIKDFIISFLNIIGKKRDFLIVVAICHCFNVICLKLSFLFFFLTCCGLSTFNWVCIYTQDVHKASGGSVSYNKILFLLCSLNRGICTNLVNANISFGKSLNSYSLYSLCHT